MLTKSQRFLGTTAVGVALLVGATLMAPLQVQAQTSLTYGSWFSFDWSDGEGPVTEQFLATTGAVAVTDGFVVGDMFAVTADGSFVGTTSSVAKDGPNTGASDGATAWADSRLSKGVFSVTPGAVIGINVIQIAEGFPSGTGFIRSIVVAEPGTGVLLVIGLLGLGLMGLTGRHSYSATAAEV